MGDKTGATVTAFKKMKDNLSLVSQELINNFKLTFIDAGLKIIDQFTGDVSGITDIFRSLQFSINDGAFDQVFCHAQRLRCGSRNDPAQYRRQSPGGAIERSGTGGNRWPAGCVRRSRPLNSAICLMASI